MLTTAALISFLKAHEKFRAKAYDDKNPHLDLNAGDEDKVEGVITIGYGTTVYASGVAVQLGDTITEPRALDELTGYVRREVEPVLENLIHEPLTDDQYNALGSVVYNFGASEVSGWRLWGRINRRETGENIALEWLDGTWTSGGEPMEGLYKRRISEVLWFFGFDWRMAANASWSTSVLSMLRQLGWDGATPKAGPVHTPVDTEVDADIFEHDFDPTPETPMTTDDLNNRQLMRLKSDKIRITKLTPSVPIDAVDYLENDGPPKVKRIEDSQRGKGYAKTQTAKEVGIAGVVGTGAVAVGAVEPVVAFVDKYPKDTILWVFVGLTFLAVAYYFYGQWQRQKGEDEATDLLG